MDQAVVDASVIVEMLRSPATAARLAATIGEPELRAPDVVNLEVLQALRRLERLGDLDPSRLAAAVRMLTIAPVERVATTSLLAEVWDLRNNLTSYDASYVALARAHECPLLTAEERLARAPGLGVEVLLFTRGTG